VAGVLSFGVGCFAGRRLASAGLRFFGETNMPTAALAREAPQGIAAAAPPALTLRELWVAPLSNGVETIELRLNLSPPSDVWTSAVAAIRRDALAALKQAKAEFLDTHSAMADLQKLERAVREVGAQRQRAEQAAHDAKAAGDAAALALSLDEQKRQYEILRQSEQDVILLARQVEALEVMIERARRHADQALRDHIYGHARQRQADAEQAWDATAAEVLRGVPLALIERLFAAGQQLAYWKANSWMGRPEENGRVLELPAEKEPCPATAVSR
jgi:hypothetical protein